MLSSSLVDSSKSDEYLDHGLWLHLYTEPLWEASGYILSFVQQMKCRFKALFSHLSDKRKAWNKSRGIFCRICNLRTVCIICCLLKQAWTWMLAGNILATELCHNTCTSVCEHVWMCSMPAFWPEVVCCGGRNSALSSNKWRISIVISHSDFHSEWIIALIGILLTEGCPVGVMDLIAIWSLERTVRSICYILLDFWKVRSVFLLV